MVPDVGEILKNKVDTDFFWFCNCSFSKFWNIRRPIVLIKVLKPESGQSRDKLVQFWTTPS